VWGAESGALLAVLRGHEDEVRSVSYRPDGRRIASGSYDDEGRGWDAESGEGVVVIQGYSNTRAIAAGPLLFPFRALARGLDTFVECTNDGHTLGCFAANVGNQVSEIVTHSSGRVWAGASGDHLYIIAIEGGAIPK
jgi:WD40 repeat protein